MSQNSTSTQQQPPSSSPTSVVVTPATAPARPTTVVPNVVSPVAANSTPIPSTGARPTSVSDPRATDIPIPLEPSSSSGGSSFFSDNAGLITGIGAAFLVLVMIIAAILRTRKKRARTDKLIQKTLEEAEKARLQELNRRGDRPPPSPSMAPSMGARYAPPPQLSRGGSQMQSPYRPPVAPFSPALAPSPQLTYSQGPYYQNGSPAQPNFGGATGIPPMSQGYRSSMERFGAPPPQPAAYGYGAPPQPRNDAYATDYVAGPEAPYDSQYEDGYENAIEPYNEQGGDYVVAAEEPGGAQPVASTKVYLDPPTKMYAQ